MIAGTKISVLMTTYEPRYGSARQAAEAWAGEPWDEFWILDGSGRLEARQGRAGGRPIVFNFPVDFGTAADYAMARLANGDLICLADDDVAPAPGFLEDLVGAWRQAGHPDAIVGLIGRTFEGPDYKSETTYTRADRVDTLTPVGFCGVVFLCSRHLFGFDLRGMPRNCDDLWMQMWAHPYAPKFVAPTKRYRDLPAAGDKTAMYRQPELAPQRREFYRMMYESIHGRQGAKGTQGAKP